MRQNSRFRPRARGTCSGKPLDADALALARRRMPGEARQALPEVAAADARPPLRVRRHRHDQIGALQADRVVARPEEQPLDDPRQLHERRAVLGQLGEEPPQARVVLAKAAVDDDHAEVVLGFEQAVEALGQEHEAGRVRVLGGGEVLGMRRTPGPLIEQRHVRGDGRGREHREERVAERRGHAAVPDEVPLDLALERPRMRGERLVPSPPQLRPVAVAHGDAAEREEPALVDLATLVDEEQVHLSPASPRGARPPWSRHRRPRARR